MRPDEVFSSTHWADSTRNLLINNVRILHVERTEGEKVVYTVTFDNGQTLDLDEGTGKSFVRQLETLRRPNALARYSEARDDNYYMRPPNYVRPPDHRRRR